MKIIAVTGVTGFVGTRFVEYNKDSFVIRSLSLKDQTIDRLDLSGVESVVHLAGKAHQMEPIDDKIYFDVNCELTMRLAVKAKQQGVGHFVYISSTKVYGDDVEGILNEQSPCNPSDAYGASKLKAEQQLKAIEDESFKIAIVRPPLVYGPRVKGNMIRLLRLADKNYPLPFGDSRNFRSMVFADNLIAFINTIVEQRATGIFVASDPEPISTDKLIKMIRAHMGNSHGLVSVPEVLRKGIKKLRPGLYKRLFGSFVVDNSAGNRLLHFVPPYTTEYGVAQMVKWYKQL